MARYLLYNPSGPAADDLLANLPADVTAVPFGWTPEIEAARNDLLATLGLSGVSSLPCVLYYELEHDADDGEGGTITVPGRWREQRWIDDHPAPADWSWNNIAQWYDDPIMLGDLRVYDGRTWESLVDYNVWQPPTNWREVVEEGYPAWVQPTGSQDAYTLGDRVTHAGSDWESTHAANVWEPGAVGSESLWTELVSAEPDAWAPGQTVTAGDQRTYQGTTYVCIQGHTTQLGWEPPNVPALWSPV